MSDGRSAVRAMRKAAFYPTTEAAEIGASVPVEIPAQVRSILDEYTAALACDLPGLVTGLYVHGSLTLGAFDPRLSDIDFLALLSRPCAGRDLAHLADIHRALERRHPRPPMEGSYLRWADVGLTGDAIEPHPHYHSGKFQRDGRGAVSPVTWWMVKNRGLALIGPDPQELEFESGEDELVAYMLPNLNTYWASFTTKPRRVIWLLFDDGIQWAVLGVLRQVYTLTERAIVSKIGAGHYGLEHLPGEWHRLIREAINVRQQTGSLLYRSRVSRAVEAYRFLNFVIDRCNAGWDAG